MSNTVTMTEQTTIDVQAASSFTFRTAHGGAYDGKDVVELALAANMRGKVTTPEKRLMAFATEHVQQELKRRAG